MRTTLPALLLLSISVATSACKKNESSPPPPSTTTSKPAPSPGAPAPKALDTANIEKLAGVKGKLDNKSGVFKVSAPRDDLAMTISRDVRMTPPMGLTSWAAFQIMGDHVMVMGDIVMTEDQVNPVMSVALDNGLEVTALHNHFFWDEPKIMFMHIGGMGEESTLASAVGKVFGKVTETRGGKGQMPPAAKIDPAKSKLDTAKLNAIFGHEGEINGGVYKVTIGRTTKMG
ncbi:MAG: DUF1259 domain-containing protein, partial [Deltaproteobacteria bacterium]|nr:DUF1259 domain-containing protein [Deltaproteobacteria bacterium]